MFFDNLKSKTTERPPTLEGVFLTRYMFASRFAKNKKVLDIGTGLGQGANLLAKKGATEVLGIDYSKIAVNHAKKTYVLPNLEFKVMNALNISSLNKSFDVIVAFEVIEHLPANSHRLFFREMKKTLNSGNNHKIISYLSFFSH